MESNEIIMSVLARCVVEPDFLALILRDPEAALASYPCSPDLQQELLGHDYGSVQQFAGFVTKVKNNPTWPHFPHTRIALIRHGLEADFFVGYSSDHTLLRQSDNRAPHARIDHFYDHLKVFLEVSPSTAAPQCLALLEHEYTLYILKAEAPSPESSTGSRFKEQMLSDHAVPVLTNQARLIHLEYPPLDLARRTEAGNSLDSVQPGECWLLYRRRGDQIQVTRQEGLAVLAISAINGQRTFAEIFELLVKAVGMQLDQADLRPFFEELFRAGVWEVREPTRKAATEEPQGPTPHY
jgi:hypothetical protein